MRKIARISGALSAKQIAFNQLYYKKGAQTLEDPASSAFQGIPPEVVSYMTDHAFISNGYLNKWLHFLSGTTFAEQLLRHGKGAANSNVFHRDHARNEICLENGTYKLEFISPIACLPKAWISEKPNEELFFNTTDWRGISEENLLNKKLRFPNEIEHNSFDHTPWYDYNRIGESPEEKIGIGYVALKDKL